MLVLSRKRGQEVVIGHNIRITFLGITGQRVRLGITAPVNTPICRGELLSLVEEVDGQAILPIDDLPLRRAADVSG